MLPSLKFFFLVERADENNFNNKPLSRLWPDGRAIGLHLDRLPRADKPGSGPYTASAAWMEQRVAPRTEHSAETSVWPASSARSAALGRHVYVWYCVRPRDGVNVVETNRAS